MTTTPTFWGTEVTFSNDTFASRPQLTVLKDGTFILGWDSSLFEPTDIFARHLNEFGSFTGGNFLSALSGADPKSLTAPTIFQQENGQVAMVYRQLFSSTETDIRWHLANADFTPATNSFGIETTAVDEFLRDATARPGGGGAIVYEVPDPPGGLSLSNTVLRFIDAVGNQASNQIFVGFHPNQSQFNAVVASVPKGFAAVAYENFNFDNNDRDVRMHVYRPDGTDLDGEILVSGAGRNAGIPEIAVDFLHGEAPLVFDPGSAKPAAGAGIIIPPIFQEIVGTIVVVWQDSAGINFRRYLGNATVDALDAAPRTISGTAGSILPKVTILKDGGFIVAWDDTTGVEGDGTPEQETFLQRFDINGNSVGSRVEIDKPGDQSISSLATLADGRVILTYASETGDSTGVTTLNYRIVDPREAAITGDNAANAIVGREDGSTISGLGGNDRLSGREAADTLFGGAGDDFLRGFGGIDTLNGGDGDDRLEGGDGNDAMAGGLGNDVYVVLQAGDTVTELAGQGFDSVRTALSVYALAGNVERLYTDTTTGIAASGNALANTIYGNNGDDRFRDYAGGADRFSGGNGSDSMYFTGTGAAVLNFATGVHGGSAAGDLYASIENFFGSNTGGDTMTAGAGRAIFNGQGGNDTLAGGASGDSLFGGAGTDTLNGGANNDALQGGAQNDMLTGGAGRDYFVYAETAASGGWGADTITDFLDGVDFLKFATTVADAFADFTITGNGTTDVLLKLAAAPANTIALHGAAPITITAADFLFV